MRKTLLETEWTKRSVLPRPRTSPPPSSAQKVHGVVPESKNTTLAPPAAPARTATPAGQVPITSSTQQHASDPGVDGIKHDSDGSEEDEPATQMDRDPQSDETIKQLEKEVKGPGGVVDVPVGNGVDGGGDGDDTRKKLRSGGNPDRSQQQQQQQPPPPPPATTTGMATLQSAHAVQSQNPYQHFQQPYVQQQQIVNQPQTQRSTTLGPDRSIVTAAGGIAAIGGPSQVEKLPADTGKFSLSCFFFRYFWNFNSCSLLSSLLY